MSHSAGYEQAPNGATLPGEVPRPLGSEQIAEEKAATQSLGDLVGDVMADLSALMRKEVELAKAEVRESGKRVGKGAGMYAGAGIAGHFVLLFLSLALWWALGTYLVGLGWSAVILAVIWAIIGAVLAVQAKKQIESMRGMPQTAETLREIPPTLKPHEETR
jgi:hypothetical protein